MSFQIIKDRVFFDDNFNRNLDENILKQIKNCNEIYFGYDFNKPVDNLPNKIRKIVFGPKFNQPVDNLPSSLEEIIFGDDFDQNIEFLPYGLKKICLGYHFGCSGNLGSKKGILTDRLWNNLGNELEELVMWDLAVSEDPIPKLPKKLTKIRFMRIRHPKVTNYIKELYPNLVIESIDPDNVKKKLFWTLFN